MAEQEIRLTSSITGTIDFSALEDRLAAIENRLEIQDRHLGIINDNLGVLMAAANFDAFNAELQTLRDTVNDAARVIGDLKAANTDQATVDAATAAVEAARTALKDAVDTAQQP